MLLTRFDLSQNFLVSERDWLALSFPMCPFVGVSSPSPQFYHKGIHIS